LRLCYQNITGYAGAMSANTFQRRPKPIMPERPQGSIVIKLFLVCLLAVGGYGGYFGYCKYKLKDIAYEFSQTARDLHQAVLRKTTNIRQADVEAAVRAMVAKHNLEIVQLTVILDPLTDVNRKKLPLMVRESLARQNSVLSARKGQAGTDSLAGTRPSYYVAGFTGTFGAKYKIAKGTFTAKRYTTFEDHVVAK
jgi:hypothetical protein